MNLLNTPYLPHQMPCAFFYYIVLIFGSSWFDFAIFSSIFSNQSLDNRAREEQPPAKQRKENIAVTKLRDIIAYCILPSKGKHLVFIIYCFNLILKYCWIETNTRNCKLCWQLCNYVICKTQCLMAGTLWKRSHVHRQRSYCTHAYMKHICVQ